MLQMPRIKAQLALVFTLGLVIMGCQNLFNPSGAADNVDLDADGLIVYGQSLLQQGDNKDAITVFENALEKDSSKSLAYYGLSKAILRTDNFNPVTVSEAMITMNSESGDALTAITDLVQGDLASNIPAIKSTTAVLTELIRRDSINDLWVTFNKYQSSEDPVSLAAGDSVELTIVMASAKDSVILADYRLYYYQYHTHDAPIYKPNEFPIMDGKVTAVRVNPEYMLLSLIETASIASNLSQITNDTAFFDNLAKGDLDLTTIAEEDIDDFNGSLETLGENLDIIDIPADLLQTEDGEQVDTDTPEFQKELERAQAVATFYKIADKEDNDGDGCVDEEIRDRIDNDGDGIIDEDARFTETDLFDNNLNNTADEAAEELNSESLLTANFGYNKSGKYILYLDSLDELTIDEQDQRRASADSIRTLIMEDVNNEISRAQRRALIGGCW